MVPARIGIKSKCGKPPTKLPSTLISPGISSWRTRATSSIIVLCELQGRPASVHAF